MVRWRIYYDDGSTFCDNDGEPEQAPTSGVVCIVGYQDGARIILNRKNYYRWMPDRKVWWTADSEFDVIWFALRNDLHALKKGVMVSDSQFSEIISRASRDPDFPQI